MALFLSIAPIVMLIILMVKKNAWPSYFALPFTALVVYILGLIFFDLKFVELNASIVSGFISTLTQLPLSLAPSYLTV